MENIQAVLEGVLSDYKKELSAKDEENVQAILRMTKGAGALVQARALAMRKAFNRDFTTDASVLFQE